MGFLLLGPEVEYPLHTHEAEEIYIPLAGTALWQRGQDDYKSQPPGTVIHHSPCMPHAIRTTEPLLALYVWCGADLTEKFSEITPVFAVDRFPHLHVEMMYGVLAFPGALGIRRSLACTNIVENALGTVRQVTRNVKRWRHAEMALRWTAAGLLEAQKTFRRLKAYRQLVSETLANH